MRQSIEEFLKGSQPQGTPVQPPVQEETGMFAMPSLREFGKTVKDVSVGFLKGAGDTANALVKGGRFLQAAVDPTKTYKETVQSAEDNLPSFFKPSQLDENLEATNAAQMTGKSLEFLAEVLFPIGRTAKGAALVDKGLKATGASFDQIASRLASVPDNVMEGGVKVKDKIVDAISTLDDKTKTALLRTPREVFDKFTEQARAAMQDDRIRTPLEQVGDNIIEGLQSLKDRASSIGQQKSELMERARIGYETVGNMAQRAALDLQRAFNGMKLDPADTKLVKEFVDQLKSLGDNPRLKDVDATIDLLQDQIYKTGLNNAVTVTDRVTGILRKQLGELNSAVQTKAGSAYQELNAQYREMIELVTELNARLGKEGASAGAFVKRLFSPSDARTKELFEKLQEYTNQDYFRDARIAKFLMDYFGDVRTKSLLEQIPDSASGVVGKVINYVKDKVSDPLDAAGRFIDKNIRGKELPRGNDTMQGMAAGVQPDENGEITFDPLTAALGAAGWTVARKGDSFRKIELIRHRDDMYRRYVQAQDKTAKNRLYKEMQNVEKELKTMK